MRAVLVDAWAVYRLLFRRSIVVALGVYSLINAIDVVNESLGSGDLRGGLYVLGLLLTFAGPILVQGALVMIVRSVHEGVAAPSSIALFRAAWSRIGSLIGASLVYSLGVVVGLLLLIPGLLAAARWCLMAPAIMLEGRWAMPARDRSAEIVRGEIGTGLGDRTRFALGVVIVSWLLTSGVSWAFAYSTYLGFWDWGAWLLGAVASTLLAPYQAHVLSVLYYRLVDPQRPTIDPRMWAAAA